MNHLWSSLLSPAPGPWPSASVQRILVQGTQGGTEDLREGPETPEQRSQLPPCCSDTSGAPTGCLIHLPLRLPSGYWQPVTHTHTPTYPQRTPSAWNSLPLALGLPLGNTPTPARRPCSPLCWGSSCLLLGGSAFFCPNQSPRSGPICVGSGHHSEQLSDFIRTQLSLGPSGS